MSLHSHGNQVPVLKAGNAAYGTLRFLAVTPKLQLQSQFVPREPASLLASQPGEPGVRKAE